MELPLHFENDKENYLYEKFETSPTVKEGKEASFETFNKNVSEAISSGKSNPYCPDGYRIPNQRELAIMVYNKLYDGSEFNHDLPYVYVWQSGTNERNAMCRTKYSFGALGAKKAGATNKYGFSYTPNVITLAGYSASSTRCVRDVRVD